MKQLSLCFLFLISLSLSGQNYADSLGVKLQSIHDLGYLPGFSVAIVDSEGIQYENGFGWSDVERQVPYTINTIQNIGSTSKTLVGISLLMLVDEGKLSLNTPINDVLPFNVVNPRYPNTPITIQHLATHTSTINDPWEYETTYLFDDTIRLTKKELPKGYMKYVKLYNQNVHMPVDEFCKRMLTPDGEWYKKKNFLKKKPGEEYNYSNVGATLAGLIVEMVSGESFVDFTMNRIIEPLGLKNTGWRHSDVDMADFATLYLSNDVVFPNYELISYADGGLISSSHQLAIYFSEMIKCYMTGDCKFISHESCKTMMEPQFISDKRKSGIFWLINGKGEFGHSGGDPGVMTYMLFDPNTGIGRIMFTNKLDDQGNGINELVYIWKTLEEYFPLVLNGTPDSD